MDPDEFLAHYGVKGMKWGVRKSEEVSEKSSSSGTKQVSPPPKPADGRGWKIEADGSIEISRGATISRVVRNNKGAFGAVGNGFDADAPMYAAFKPGDIADYEATWGRPQSFLVKNADSVLKMTPKTKLKAPGVEESVTRYLKEVQNSSPETKQAYLDSYGDKKGKLFEKALANPKSMRAYEFYTHGIDNGNYNDTVIKSINERFYDGLKKSGYNMIVDPADSSFLFDAPIIIFDPKKSVDLTAEYLVTKESRTLAKKAFKSAQAERGKRYLESLGF